MTMTSERNVLLSVKCAICNKVYAVYVTNESWKEFNSLTRRNIQDVFSYLDPEDRELLISNICPMCWNEMFSCDCDEDDELMAMN